MTLLRRRKYVVLYVQGVITEQQRMKFACKFRSGETSFEKEPRSGRTTDFDDAALKSLVESDPQQITREK